MVESERGERERERRGKEEEKEIEVVSSSEYSQSKTSTTASIVSDLCFVFAYFAKSSFLSDAWISLSFRASSSLLRFHSEASISTFSAFCSIW